MIPHFESRDAHCARPASRARARRVRMSRSHRPFDENAPASARGSVRDDILARHEHHLNPRSAVFKDPLTTTYARDGLARDRADGREDDFYARGARARSRTRRGEVGRDRSRDAGARPGRGAAANESLERTRGIRACASVFDAAETFWIV